MPQRAREEGLSTENEPALDLLTVAALSVFVTAVSIGLREGAHVIAAHLGGGDPTSLSAAGVRGDWTGLSDAGYLSLGASGAVANAVLALVGWLWFRRGVGAPTSATAMAWLFFATNAWMATIYLAGSPLLGAGDWMIVIDRFPNRGPLRVSLVVTGFFIAGLVWKETVPSLARLIGNGPAPDRRARAMRFVRTAWLTGGAVAAAAALLSPSDSGSMVTVALGGTLSTTWPMLIAGRKVGAHPVPGGPLDLERSPWIVAVGLLAGAALIGVLGPGFTLG